MTDDLEHLSQDLQESQGPLNLAMQSRCLPQAYPSIPKHTSPQLASLCTSPKHEIKAHLHVKSFLFTSPHFTPRALNDGFSHPSTYVLAHTVPPFSPLLVSTVISKLVMMKPP